MPILLSNFHSIRWLLAELFIIVLGISIAFQVEEWRSERAERALEKEILQSILTDFEIAAEQFGRYLEDVDGHYSAIRELREQLQSSIRRSEVKLMETVFDLGGGYNWQATDSTFQSISPSIISEATLRRELVAFHDGFMPFMLNLSTRYQDTQSVFLDVLFDDFRRELFDANEPDDFAPPIITNITPIDDIPTHKEFYEKMDNYEIVMWNLKRRIPEALQRIGGLESKIEQHIQTL